MKGKSQVKIPAKKSAASKGNRPAAKKSRGRGNSDSRASLMTKVQNILEENEETIHFVLEIAAVSIDKSNMSEKKKKIARAALLLLNEVIDAAD